MKLPATAPDAAEQEQSSGARTTVASMAALGGVLAAAGCCLPLFPVMLAAGAAGSSAFLSAARPYLLAVSAMFLAYGFYQSSRAKKCQRRPSVISSVLLWTSTGFLILSVLFPQLLANAVADFIGR
jgi:hypothetical protein